jgi:hypothetical protein
MLPLPEPARGFRDRLVGGVCLWRSPMLRKDELIFTVVIVNVSMARLRLFARLWRRFALWNLFHGSRSAVSALRCQNRAGYSVTAVTSRTKSEKIFG